MRSVLWLVAALLLSGLFASTAAADDIRVGWRSPYGVVLAVAVNEADGSCWAVSGTCVIHVSAEGTLLSQTSEVGAVSVSVDPRDGSCWVADQGRGEVVKLDRHGTEVVRAAGFTSLFRLSVNTADGTCWVTDGSQVVHLASDGTELWRGGDLVAPSSVSANASDGSVWIADAGAKAVVHLSVEGVELLRETFSHYSGRLDDPEVVAVNPVDGSCWVGLGPPTDEVMTTSLVHLAADGTRLFGNFGFGVGAVAVDPADSSCWAAEGGLLVHWSGGGDVFSAASAPQTYGLAVNPLDGSVWTAQLNTVGLAHRSQFGVLIDQVKVSGIPQALSDVGDGSFWVGIAGTWDAGLGEHVGALVQRLSPDRGVLASSSAFQNPGALGAVRSDASCWVVDEDTGEAVHLSSAGEELTRVGGFDHPAAVAIDPYGDSVWVADTGHNEVVQLDAAGAELSRTGGFSAPAALAAFGTFDGNHDGCWVADTGDGAAVRLDSAGVEDERMSGFSEPGGLAADLSFPWVADTGNHRVVRIAPDFADPILWSNESFVTPSALARGTSYVWVMDDAGEIAALHVDTGAALWRAPVPHPTAIAANGDRISNFAWPDGSVWVGSSALKRVYHYAGEGSVRWHGQTFQALGVVSAYGQDGSCWVGTSGMPNYAQGAYGAVRIDGEGVRLAEMPPMTVGWIRTDQTDGSAWVTKGPESGATAIAHISAAGEVLNTWGSYQSAAVLDYNPHDQTLWLAMNSPPQVLHLTTDGTQISASTGLSSALCVSANPNDDTCWVTDKAGKAVVHLAPDGSEIKKLTGFDNPLWVTVDPGDGSIWVTDNNPSPSENGKLSHLGADGTVVWSSTAFQQPMQPVLKRQDHSVWVADVQAGFVVHLAGDGTELWRGEDFGNPMYLSLDPVDGSLWISAPPDAEVTHLITVFSAGFTAEPRFGSVPLSVAFKDESSSTATSWTWDFGDGASSTGKNPTHTYTEPGYYSVALTVSKAGATGTETKVGLIAAGFADTPPNSSAFYEILGCVQAGVVQGYPWTQAYKPALPVTRGQMAIYIARALVSPSGDAAVAEPPAGTQTFPDVDPEEDAACYKYVEFCAAKNIVRGFADGNYKPDKTANRGQMAIYIARALVTPSGDAAVPEPPEGEQTFPDVTAEDNPTFFRHVEFLAADGVVEGFWDGLYHPDRDVRRGQMALYVQRAFDLPVYPQ